MSSEPRVLIFSDAGEDLCPAIQSGLAQLALGVGLPRLCSDAPATEDRRRSLGQRVPSTRSRFRPGASQGKLVWRLSLIQYLPLFES